MGECPGRCHARLRRFHLTFSRRLLAKDAKRRTSKSSHQRAHQPHSPFSCHFHLLWDSRRLYPGNCSKLCLTSLTLRICHKISQHIPRFLNFSENCSFCSSWYWAFDHPIQNRRRMEFIFYKNPMSITSTKFISFVFSCHLCYQCIPKNNGQVEVWYLVSVYEVCRGSLTAGLAHSRRSTQLGTHTAPLRAVPKPGEQIDTPLQPTQTQITFLKWLP